MADRAPPPVSCRPIWPSFASLPESRYLPMRCVNCCPSRYQPGTTQHVARLPLGRASCCPCSTEQGGIFAIRSPHRPNHIGFSIVKVKKIEGNRLYFTEVDVLDGTPVLDIKPYVKQFDCRPDAVSGWIERHFNDGKSPENTIAL